MSRATNNPATRQRRNKILKAAKLVQSLLEDHGAPAATP